MTMFEPMTLGGCTPTPLASYLKALGVLRLLSSDANHVTGSAADPQARGWWENEHFRLTTRLSRESLQHFFLEDYAPSPIIAPWNGGSGFYPKDNQDGFEPLSSAAVAKRFAPIAEAIEIAAGAIARRALARQPDGDAKLDLVASLRAELPDPAIDWLDAVLALSGDGLSYPQLLGSGGNDGRLDFTNNFMRRLVSRKRPSGVFDATSGNPQAGTDSLLGNALFDTPTKGLDSAAIGQFSPGATGGPNATTGYKADGNVNPWDFILMLEGAVTLAGAATRRHQGSVESGASFPFTVRAVGAGWGGIDAADENDARAEFWAPLWRRPARLREVVALLAEGRAVLNGRTARDSLEFARSATSLGVSRGFSEFERYGFLMRAGKAYLAAPVGRRSATRSDTVKLVADLDAGDWLWRVRQVGRTDGEPAAARNAIKRFEDALFELAEPTPSPDRIQRALITLGEVCGWLAVSRKGREAVRTPPPALSSDWIRKADDGSAEFRIAAALAGIGFSAMERRTDAEPETEPVSGDDDTAEGRPETTDLPEGRQMRAPPMAAHFASIDETRFFNSRSGRMRPAWSDNDASPSVVWGAGGLVANMIAVLERRAVEGAIRGLADKPLSGAMGARLADIAEFLSEEDFCDTRCAALLAGMVWARPAAKLHTRMPGAAEAPPTSIPFVYAILKPIFTPARTLRSIRDLAEVMRIPIPSGMITRLRAGGGALDGQATDEAARAALSRARSSGLSSPFDPARTGNRRTGTEGGRIGAGIRPDRLAAALLIPVDEGALNILIRRAYPGALSEENHSPAEDMNNAA